VKSFRLLCLQACFGAAATLSAQTLFIPSGTGGISNAATGNVGIGTANANRLLSLNGSSNAYLGFKVSDTLQSTIGSDGNGDFFIFDDQTSTYRMVVTTAGSVGIGTTTPATRLDVVGGAIRADGGVVSRLSTPGGLFVGYGSGLDGSSLQMFAIYADTTNGLYFDAPKDGSGNKFDIQFNWRGGGVPGLIIKGNTGNVGVGTTNPTARLHTVLNGGGSIARFESTVNNDGQSYIYNRTVNTVSIWGAFDYQGTRFSYVGTESSHPFAIITSNAERMRVDASGNVGIGTSSPSHKLAVNGTIRAKEVIVDTGWSDYVFADDYRLASLAEVESHIKAERHLPGIPSAQEVADHGVSMGEMQAKLLAKIEELTLHQIAQEKRLVAQEKRTVLVENENAALHREIVLLKRINPNP
jgi:hypothetical protein